MDGGRLQQDAHAEIYADQVALLYGYVPLVYTVTLINGLILIFIQRPYFETSVLFGWYGCLTLVTVGRFALAQRYSKVKPNISEAACWERRYLVGVGLAGITWGSSAVFLYPAEDVGHQVFVAFVLAGMSAAGLLVLASRLAASAIFLIAALSPLILRLISHGGELHTAMGAMVFLYLLGLLSIARKMNLSIYNTLILRYDNQALEKEIARRQQAENALFAEKTRLQITLASLAESVVIADAVARIRYLNPAAEQLSGWSSQEARKRPIGEIFHTFDEEGQPSMTAVEICLKGARRAELHTILMTRDGRKYSINEVATPLWDRHGKLVGAVAIFRDVTEARRITSQLARQANYDALTQLPNRHLLRDRLNHAINRAQRTGRGVAVLFVDLDHFKKINDSLGHAAGDVMLQTVAARLQACVRREDTVARLGGDEFVILLEDLTDVESVGLVSQKVIASLSPACVIEGHDFFITCSLGISLYPKDGSDEQSLLKNADIAMYRAKEQGRNNFQFFTSSMNREILDRLSLENDLRYALERGQLLLYYQPQVALGSGQVVGVEALLRWQHPQRGLVLPDTFIPLAEESGLIIPIGAWVLRTACAQAKSWQTLGLPPMRVAVNLSVRQIFQSDFADLVATVLRETGLEPELLELEITENLLMQHLETSINILTALKGMGVQLAIDDFGTGYSSLPYIKRFPLDRIKIDQSFVRDITTDAGDAAIAIAVIAMAHSMHLKVVAEGVETDAQLSFFREQQCNEMQGFHFSQPVPADDITRLLGGGGPGKA